jgi:copper transport protein
MSALRGIRVLLITVLVWGCALLAAPGASAHADLLRSTPANGARLTGGPTRIELDFSEPVSLAQSQVSLGTDRLGLQQAAGGRTLLAQLTSAERVGKGAWSVDWRAVAADDGHVTSGRIAFQVAGAPAEPAPPAVAPAPPSTPVSVRYALLGTRLAEYASLAVFLGGLAFLALLWPQGADDRRTRTVVTLAWLIGLVAAVLSIGTDSLYASFGPLGALFSAHTYTGEFGSHFGIVLAARALLWLLAGVVLAGLLQAGERAARSPGWRLGTLALGFGLLRTTGMAGHDAGVAHPAWGQIADMVHLVSVSLWIGGLVLLLAGVLPRRRPEELAFVVPRYSTLALVCVVGIAATGSVLAWQLVGSWSALVATSYGRLLLIKISLLAVTLLAAQRSKLWVRDRLDVAVLLRGDAASVRPFVYSIAAETAFVLGVLTATSLLVGSNPGQ